MERTARIYGINGPLVTIQGETDLKMGEMVYVGEEKLVGEVIRLNSEMATIQVFEETSGLKPGETIYPTGATLSVTWLPASSQIFLTASSAPWRRSRKNPGPTSTAVFPWTPWIWRKSGRQSSA